MHQYTNIAATLIVALLIITGPVAANASPVFGYQVEKTLHANGKVGWKCTVTMNGEVVYDGSVSGKSEAEALRLCKVIVTPQ